MKPELTDAIVGCQTDVISLIAFQNYFFAVGNFLLLKSPDWLVYLDSSFKSGPADPRIYRTDYHHDFLAQHMLRGAADMLMNYLTDLLRLIMVTHPEVMRSSAQVRVEEILRHRDLDEFVGWYAERQVNELSYKSLVDLDAYFSERLGLPICEDPETFRWLRRLVAQRNLLVHARGVINDLYRKAADDPEAVLGAILELDFDEATEAPNRVYDAVKLLDARAAQKFGL